MGHTNSTANLSLPQFIGTDKPTWLGDVNGAFSAIDSYAGTNDAAVAAAASDASSAISQAAAAVNTANTASTTAGNASTAANNAIGVANTANAIAGTVDAKVGLLADLTTTDRTSIVNAINEVNAAVGTPTASQVTYDNTDSGLTATNVQAAIDEVAQGGGGFTLTELYSNPDDTQNQAAGTLVSASDQPTYKAFLIIVKWNTTDAGYFSVLAVPGLDFIAFIPASNIESHRMGSITQSNGIVTVTCTNAQTNDNTVVNSHAIITKIYGIA